MIPFLQLFLQLVFTLLILGCTAALLFAVIADLMGWYDSRGRYNGPFSKARRK